MFPTSDEACLFRCALGHSSTSITVSLLPEKAIFIHLSLLYNAWKQGSYSAKRAADHKHNNKP